jgi:hypothetical protein
VFAIHITIPLDWQPVYYRPTCLCLALQTALDQLGSGACLVMLCRSGVADCHATVIFEQRQDETPAGA